MNDVNCGYLHQLIGLALGLTMKSIFPAVVVFAIGTLPSGCSIHPLPEDTKGVDTLDIVKHVRCETREALIELFAQFLANPDEGKVDLASRAVGLHYFGERSRPLSAFEPKLLSGNARQAVELFWETGIAYNFQLGIKENNDFTAGVGFGNPFTRGTTTGTTQMDVGGSLNRQRISNNAFTITDTIKKLITKVPGDFCQGQLVGPDDIYPITGKIGMKEVIGNFVNLTIYGNLGSRREDKNPAAFIKGPPTMVAAVTFETAVIGKVNPAKVIYSPIANHFALLNATVSTELRRTDTHAVTVGLALEQAAVSQLEPYQDAIFARYGGLRTPAASRPSSQARAQGTLFGRFLTASGSPAEVAAAQAVDQFLTQRLFSPVININP